MKHMSPLPASFMLTSIIGGLITLIYTVYGKIPTDWGISFGIIFAIMFMASIVSITPEFPQKK